MHEASLFSALGLDEISLQPVWTGGVTTTTLLMYTCPRYCYTLKREPIRSDNFTYNFTSHSYHQKLTSYFTL